MKAGWILPICLGVLAVLLGGLWAANRVALESQTDQLFRDLLGGGDPAVAYRLSDANFQGMYSQEAFLDYARQNPQVFQRDEISAKDIAWLRTPSRSLYVMIKTRVAAKEVSFYCRPSERHAWKLVGIDPDLMAAVPENLKPMD